MPPEKQNLFKKKKKGNKLGGGKDSIWRVVGGGTDRTNKENNQ